MTVCAFSSATLSDNNDYENKEQNYEIYIQFNAMYKRGFYLINDTKSIYFYSLLSVGAWEPSVYGKYLFMGHLAVGRAVRSVCSAPFPNSIPAQPIMRTLSGIHLGAG